MAEEERVYKVNSAALDENKAWAIIYANTKRKRRDENIVTIAKCFDYLIKVHSLNLSQSERNYQQK